MLRRRWSVIQGVIRAHHDGAGDRRQYPRAGEIGASVVGVGATPQNHPTTAVRDHIVDITTIVADHRCLKRGVAMTAIEDSTTATMIAGGRHLGRWRGDNRSLVYNGQTETVKAIQPTANTRAMRLETSRRTSLKPHNRRSMRRRSRRCRTSFRDSSPCSHSHRHLHQCHSRRLAAFLEAFRLRLHQTTVGHLLPRHRTLLRCQTIHTTSTTSGMTFRKAVRQGSTNKTKAVSRTRRSIRTNTLAKVVIKAGVVDTEATKVVGTTTTEVAAGSEVVGIRDSSRERESPLRLRLRESPLSLRLRRSPLNMSHLGLSHLNLGEQSLSPRPMWNHPVQSQNHAMIP